MDGFPTESSDTLTAEVAPLRRVLKLWDLVFYGMVTVGPAAPVTVFGLALYISHGHAILAILNGMVAMVLTAVSYGRMAALYPSAGSAYTYVARSLNQELGLLAGWAMLLDYVVMPMFCVIYTALLAKRVLPDVPYIVLTAAIAFAITFFNLCGIRFVARVNQVILALTGVVFIYFFVLAFQYLFHRSGWKGFVSLSPIYDPRTFSWAALAAGTSFAGLNYLGFDSVTTLAEDVENPRRNVLVATVSLVVIVGIFTGVVIYVGQLVGPDYRTMANIETGFMDVVQRVGGRLLYVGFTVLLALATAGSAVTAVTAAARLLFGFGRDNVIPRAIFARHHPRTNTFVWNILILGTLAFVGSLFVSYELASEIIVFGAFVGFVAVNLATIRQFYFLGVPGQRKRVLPDLIAPGLGFLFCLAIAVGLPRSAILSGCAWFAAGFAYYVFRPRSARNRPVVLVE
jgi:putrescine importer